MLGLLFNLENGSSEFLQKTGNKSPGYMVSHPRRAVFIVAAVRTSNLTNIKHNWYLVLKLSQSFWVMACKIMFLHCLIDLLWGQNCAVCCGRIPCSPFRWGYRSLRLDFMEFIFMNCTRMLSLTVNFSTPVISNLLATNTVVTEECKCLI
jgi:hypothetical protein